jgi:hypothetical protein
MKLLLIFALTALTFLAFSIQRAPSKLKAPGSRTKTTTFVQMLTLPRSARTIAEVTP